MSKSPLSRSVPPKLGGGSAGLTASAAISSTLAFYQDDFGKTLFPLRTNRELIQRGETQLKQYIGQCLDPKEKGSSFLAQQRVYANKSGLHLRRAVKLDPIAEYYIYDVVFRNRRLFRKPHSKARNHYGYRFEGAAPISSSAAYKGFKGALADYSGKYPYYVSFDVASYFNSTYNHDLVNWFTELGASVEDCNGLGQLLREINSGRSIDCLPQGIYPTKMIGNDFLRFIDDNRSLRCDQLIRFMDDVYLFSNDKNDIAKDFLAIQKLLGDKGLSVNPQKTRWGTAAHAIIDKEIDDIKKRLLDRRRVLVTTGYDETGDDGEDVEILVKKPLSDKELAYIDGLLNKSEIEEDDAELILTIMRNNTNKVEGRLPYLIKTYPHLTKSVYGFCANVRDKESIATLVLDIVHTASVMTEFQLFWFAVMLEDYLLETSKASSLINELFHHAASTSITKAKILEIPDPRFGLSELRNDFLKSGQSDWLAWASAVGSRALQPTTRNHMFKYFGKSSRLNGLIATIMTQ